MTIWGCLTVRWKSLINIFLSLAITIATILFNFNKAYAKNDSEIQSLIIYTDSKGRIDENVFILDQLLSHYSTTEIIADSQVTKLHDYDFIIYVGVTEKKLHKSLINMITSFENTVIFIGHNVNQFSSRIEVNISSHYVEVIEIAFNDFNKKLALTSLKKIHSMVLPSSYVSLINGSRGKYVHPIFVTNGNDYYLATHQINDELMYFFAEKLMNIYGLKYVNETVAFIKIEDVHPATNIEALTQITGFLASKNIPIILAVSPIYIDPTTSQPKYFSDSREHVIKLQSLQKLGADIVFSYPVFEEGLNSEMKKEIIEEQLYELVTHQLYPIAVSFPSYFQQVSQEDIDIVSSYFSTLVTGAKRNSQTILKYNSPYITKPSYLNEIIWIPETLDPIDEIETTSFLRRKQKIKQLEIVSSSVLGLSFPSYQKVSLLKEVADELEDIQGGTWLELKTYDHFVTSPYVTIQLNNEGVIDIQNEIPSLKEWIYKYRLSYFELALWTIAFVVTLFVIIFCIYSIHLKLKLRKSLFFERRNHG